MTILECNGGQGGHGFFSDKSLLSTAVFLMLAVVSAAGAQISDSYKSDYADCHFRRTCPSEVESAPTRSKASELTTEQDEQGRGVLD